MKALTFVLLSVLLASNALADGEIGKIEEYADDGARCCELLKQKPQWILDVAVSKTCQEKYGTYAVDGSSRGAGYCTPFRNAHGGWKYKCEAAVKGTCRTRR